MTFYGNRKLNSVRRRFPAAEALIDLRQSATKRTVRDSVEYLAADFPEQVQLLSAHLNAVEAFFSQKINQPKSVPAKAKKLVFHVLAKHFGITASYAERWLGPSRKSDFFEGIPSQSAQTLFASAKLKQPLDADEAGNVGTAFTRSGMRWGRGGI